MLYILFTFAACIAAVQPARAGFAPDPLFNAGGSVILDLFNQYESFTDVAINSQGKIIAVGGVSIEGKRDAAVLRFHADGSLDTSFATDGIYLFDLSDGDEIAMSVDIAADNKIIVTGSSNNTVFVVRLDQNGALDNSFGVNGIATYTLATGVLSNVKVALRDSQSRSLVGATYMFNSGGSTRTAMLVICFTANGQLDVGFGSGGVVTLDAVNANLGSLFMHDNGDILIGGYYADDLVFAKLQTGGVLDTAFGANGYSIIAASNNVILTDVLFDASLNSYFASSINGAALIRLSPDGVIDHVYDLKPEGDDITKLDLNHISSTADGELLLAGVCTVANKRRAFFAMFNPFFNGTIESHLCESFSLSTDPVAGNAGDSTSLALAQLKTGEIVMAGYYFNSLNNDFALMKLSESAAAAGSSQSSESGDSAANAEETSSSGESSGSSGGGGAALWFVLLAGILLVHRVRIRQSHQD
ncbi:MAG: hypothetical protein MJA83_10990 [Gammaproteobacteria bacterium]|nr:hypothetical protein [Gammaproteobacteria bacterium]